MQEPCSFREGSPLVTYLHSLWYRAVLPQGSKQSVFMVLGTEKGRVSKKASKSYKKEYLDP